MALTACRQVPIIEEKDLFFGHGLFILNEGNMGSNKASIDFYDIETDSLYRNIYPTVNPTVIKELGDVGNDIQIYGSKLYAAINVSGKLEVMDTQARRLGQVNIPNCRSLAFDGGYAYLTSYAGPVQMDVNYKQLGYVAKIDTATLTMVDSCLVGYQPNGIVSDGRCLYVANSGGYMAPNYDSTISVISLASFREERKIAVAINLNQLAYDDATKALYVTSLGDYFMHPATLYQVDLIDTPPYAIVTDLHIPVQQMHHVGHSIYYYAADAEDAWFGIFDTRTCVNTRLPISPDDMRTPYSIYAEYERGDIYITDAYQYIYPGFIYRYTNDGQLISTHRTGDIPAHICVKGVR